MTNMMETSESRVKGTRRIKKQDQLDNLGTDKIVELTTKNKILEKIRSKIGEVVRRNRKVEK